MIGFDIGGTKCSVSVGHEKNGSLIIDTKKVIPTQHDISPYEMTEKMCVLAEELTREKDIVGISCGGPLNSETGVINSPPNLPGWDNVKITEYVSGRMECEAYIQNDANACAVAEWKYGAGVGFNNLVFFTFGTGLGAGLILDGKLYSGANGMAGEAGHIRLSPFGPIGYGKSGSFEGFCSGNGIAQLGRIYAEEAFQTGKNVSYCADKSEIGEITAKRIAECAENGSADALKIFDICAEKLGEGLSVIIDILNPEAIILGSIYQRCENLLKKRMWEVIERESLYYSHSICKILPAKLKDNIGDYAALSVAAINRKGDRNG